MSKYTAFEKAIIENIVDGKYYVEQGHLSTTWTTGGITGGNCWGGSANLPVQAGREPEFTDLDMMLESLCPNISFLHYRRLVQEVVNYTNRSEREYYGNYYEYAIKSVDLKQLEEYLITKQLWTPPSE